MSAGEFHCYPSLEVFFYENKDRVFRYWFRDAEEGSVCDYAYIRDVIKLDNGDYMLGLLPADGDYEEKYPNDRVYTLLSKIDLQFHEGDDE